MYSEAARDLGTRLLAFADSRPGGRVLGKSELKVPNEHAGY